MNHAGLATSLSDVLADASAEYSVTIAQILGRSRVPAICRARKSAMAHLWQLGYTQAQVATAFGRVSPSTVCFAVRARKYVRKLEPSRIGGA